MKQSRLGNIQWRHSLFGAAVAGLVSLVTIATILPALQLDLLTLFSLRWLEVPVPM